MNEDNLETRTGAMPMAGALLALRLNSVTSWYSIQISGDSPQGPVLLAPPWMSWDSPKEGRQHGFVLTLVVNGLQSLLKRCLKIFPYGCFPYWCQDPVVPTDPERVSCLEGV